MEYAAEPIERLYREEAEAYEAFSTDRDFQAQCQFLRTQFRQSGRYPVAELFSGPAYHSSILRRQGHSVICMDASPEMKALACRDGGIDTRNYIIGTIPDDVRRSFGGIYLDCVFILRYSVGLISPNQVSSLLSALRPTMIDSSSLILEIHSKSMLNTDLNDLGIRP